MKSQKILIQTFWKIRNNFYLWSFWGDCLLSGTLFIFSICTNLDGILALLFSCLRKIKLNLNSIRYWDNIVICKIGFLLYDISTERAPIHVSNRSRILNSCKMTFVFIKYCGSSIWYRCLICPFLISHRVTNKSIYFPKLIQIYHEIQNNSYGTYFICSRLFKVLLNLYSFGSGLMLDRFVHKGDSGLVFIKDLLSIFQLWLEASLFCTLRSMMSWFW